MKTSYLSAAKHGRAAIALVALVIASLVGSACAQPGAQGPSGGSKGAQSRPRCPLAFRPGHATADAGRR